MHFTNRETAGRELAETLRQFAGPSLVILSLPRGGTVLGVEIAKTLNAPLGIILVRKIGHPVYAEYAIGAVAENSNPIYNEAEATTLDVTWLTAAEHDARSLIKYRRNLYPDTTYALPRIEGKIVIIVDDGIATGLTMKAAAAAARANHPKMTVIAAPVASRESLELLAGMADAFFILDDPKRFLGAISAHYLDFPQVNDAMVKKLLERSTP